MLMERACESKGLNLLDREHIWFSEGMIIQTQTMSLFDLWGKSALVFTPHYTLEGWLMVGKKWLNQASYTKEANVALSMPYKKKKE